MSRPFALLLAALCLLPLSACDETGPGLTLEQGVDVAVDDAILARDRGDYAQAVDLLGQALESEPTNAVVRVELATTLLQRDGIDLIDLDRVGQYLTTFTGETGSAATAGRGVCSYASDPNAEAFDPAGVDGFEDILAYAATLEEAKDLLQGLLPDAIQSFDLCTTVVDGKLAYDREGAVADLRALGLSEDRIAQALAVSAVSTFMQAYLYISEELPETTTWYRLSDGSIAICADDEDAVREQAEDSIRGLGQALLSLDTRASLLGSGSVAAEIVDTALDVYIEFEDAVADYCTAE